MVYKYNNMSQDSWEHSPELLLRVVTWLLRIYEGSYRKKADTSLCTSIILIGYVSFMIAPGVWVHFVSVACPFVIRIESLRVGDLGGVLDSMVVFMLCARDENDAARTLARKYELENALFIKMYPCRSFPRTPWISTTWTVVPVS